MSADTQMAETIIHFKLITQLLFTHEGRDFVKRITHGQLRLDDFFSRWNSRDV